jgi:hypothetical protein
MYTTFKIIKLDSFADIQISCEGRIFEFSGSKIYADCFTELT